MNLPRTAGYVVAAAALAFSFVLLYETLSHVAETVARQITG